MAPDDLPASEDLRVFAAVVEHDGLSGAARALGLPKSTLSRRLARLEAQVGVPLFARNHHRLLLSPVGRGLLDAARHALDALEAFAEQARASHAEPGGRLRVSLPLDLSGYPEVWLAFVARYPRIALEADFSNRHVDVVREGFDLALRAGRGHDETLIARPVGHYALVAVASPGFVAQHGRLEAPADLRRTSCVLLSPMRPRPGLPDRPEPPHRHVVVDEPHFALRAAIEGVGVAILPPPLVEPALASGALVTVLDAYAPLRVPLFAVFPDRAAVRAAVRVFIEHAAEAFGE